MKDFLINFVKDFGAIEWICVWLLLFAPPVITFGVALSAFQKKETRVGALSLAVGMILAGLLGLLLWSAGAQMVQMTIASAGAFVIGILALAAFCLAIYPIGWVGLQLRAAYEYRRRGNWQERGRKSLLFAGGGLIVLGALVVVIDHIGSPLAAIIFAVVALGILVLGFFRRFLVPEI